MLLPGALEYSIEISMGWVVVVETSSGALRAFLAGHITHPSYSETLVATTVADFSLKSFELERDLTTFAEAQIARNIGRGEPERFADVVGGLPALGFSWTDGIFCIATWFVAPRPDVAVRIDHAIPGLPVLRADERREGASLLAMLRWIDPPRSAMTRSPSHVALRPQHHR